jgi:2'-5' RNA ligase
MRLFFAIELPEPLRLEMARLSDSFHDFGIPAKCFARPENLHITLKFLGEVAEAEAARLCEALNKVKTCESFALHPSKIECLPERGPIRIVSVGFDGDLDHLRHLHDEVESICDPLGFPRESRRFRPHATLARLRNFLPNSSRSRLEATSMARLASFNFDVLEIVLMESFLESSGARYVPLARFPLSGDPLGDE